MQSHLAKVKVLPASVPFWRLQGRICFCAFFSLPHSLACDLLLPGFHPSPKPAALHLSDTFPWPYLLLTNPSWKRFSNFKDPCDYTGPIWIRKANLPISRPIGSITAVKCLVPRTLTFIGSRDAACGHLQGATFFLSQNYCGLVSDFKIFSLGLIKLFHPLKLNINSSFCKTTSSIMEINQIIPRYRK